METVRSVVPTPRVVHGFGFLTQENIMLAEIAYQLPVTPDPARLGDDCSVEPAYPIAQVSVASWENKQLVAVASTHTLVTLHLDDGAVISGVLRAARMANVWELLPVTTEKF